MKNLLSRHLLWLSVAASLLAYVMAVQRGANIETVLLFSALLSLGAGMVAERVLPFKSAWHATRPELKTDLVSAFVLVAVMEPLLKWAVPAAGVALYAHVGAPSTGVSAWSLPLQILAATLVIELGRYGSHRLHHRWQPLWWLHAMHHSSERLYTLNNLRFHPLNHAINFVAGFGTALLIGFDPLALAGYLALTQPVVMLQHANADLRSGWLNYVFSTNELHRWHHATRASQANTNFGSALVLWDQVFGTFRHVPGQAPQSVGLFEDSARSYPARAGYFAQLWSMLSSSCCRAAA